MEMLLLWGNGGQFAFVSSANTSWSSLAWFEKRTRSCRCNASLRVYRYFTKWNHSIRKSSWSVITWQCLWCKFARLFRHKEKSGVGRCFDVVLRRGPRHLRDHLGETCSFESCEEFSWLFLPFSLFIEPPSLLFFILSSSLCLCALAVNRT